LRYVKFSRRLPALALALAGLTLAAPEGRAANADIPVLVPLTGFLSVEGASQRNGAVLALEHPPAGVHVRYSVSDTGTSPEVAVNAFERAVDSGKATAVVATMFGTQLLAMLPVDLRYKVPMITISGTAAVTEQGSPYIFRFFPGDPLTKAAQVYYAVKRLHIEKPAVIYQTTAYGQSGHVMIDAALKRYGIAPVFEEGLDISDKDMVPVLSKAKAAGADSLLLQLHSGPTALFMKAAAAFKVDVPIVAGSALSQPAVAALLSPAELKGACAESGSSPLSGETEAMRQFVERYRHAFHTEPDSFALQQYDGTMMLLHGIAQGAVTPAEVTHYLATASYRGLAMTYKSNGHGDMAHTAVIICYDGKSRVPYVALHYREGQAD